MMSDRPDQIEDLCHAALQCDPSDRAAFLASACGGDEALCREVESLLVHADTAEDFIEITALQIIAQRRASTGWDDGEAPLPVGTRLGQYEIKSALGTGGMGEVYLAEDTRLNRRVAIKLLSTRSANDEEAKRRLLLEARAAAALDHPNICAIHEVSEAQGRPFIVMQYVEGETLAASMNRKPLDLARALAVAMQVASALVEAHRHGIVHLDIKPQNIMLAPHGAVKVLDFGLARIAATVGSRTDAASEVTAPVVIAGTMPYMSPEQLRGEALDGRSDIFSFGSVLCELLTGAHPFAENSVARTMSAILTRELPPLQRESAAVPAELERVVRKCLEKDRASRYQTASDLVFDLESGGRAVLSKEGWSDGVPSVVAGFGSTLAARRRPMLVTLTATLVSAGLILTWLFSRAAPETGPISSPATLSPRMSHFPLSLPSGVPLVVTPWLDSVAMSRDGSHLAFRSTGGAWGIRSQDGLNIQRIGGGGNFVHGAFFSPDGEWLGFLDAEDSGRNHPAPLMKIPIRGGPAVHIATVGTRFLGASWGADGTIVFAVGAGVFRVSAAGGRPQLIASSDQASGEVLSWPEVLPGNRWALITVTLEGSGERTIEALDIRTGTRRVLPIEGGGRASFVSGHLVYTSGGTMYAVAFDVDALDILSDPGKLIMNVRDGDFALSDGGTLAYVSGGDENRELVWVDRRGREETIPASPRQYNYPRLSPDGNKVALDIMGPNRDIWVWDRDRETLERFTTDPAENLMPVWSHDGKRIAYGQRSDISKLFWQANDGLGLPEPLNDTSVSRIPIAFTPRDKELIFSEEARDILALSLDGSHRVKPLLNGPHSEGGANFSPNGQWMAYQSNESGRFEVHVRSFPDVNRDHWQISTEGGSQPLWSRDGRELFYRDLGGSLMAVKVTTEPTFVRGPVVKLFENAGYAGAGGLVMGRTYDVSLDGQRFLMIKLPVAAPDAPKQNSLILVPNWFQELKRLAPARSKRPV